MRIDSKAVMLGKTELKIVVLLDSTRLQVSLQRTDPKMSPALRLRRGVKYSPTLSFKLALSKQNAKYVLY